MIYLDETLPRHPKIVQAGQLIGGKDGRLVALGLYVDAITYARHQVTDGIVPSPVIDEYPRRAGGRYTPATALVKVGLFEPASGGRYLIHDYHDWNPTAAEVKEAKRLAREKKAAWRAGKRGGVPGGVPPVSPEDTPQTGQRQGGTPDVHDPPSPIPHPPSRTSEGTVPLEREQPAAETAPAALLSPSENQNDDPESATSKFDSPIFDKPKKRSRERLATEPKGDNYRVLSKIAREAIAAGSTYGDLPHDVETRAKEAGIGHDRDVVLRACESEWFKHEHPDLVRS